MSARLSTFVKIGCVLLLSVSVSACNVLSPPKTNPVDVYALTSTPKIATPVKQTNGPTVLISSLTAAPGYDTTAMAYLEKPYRMNYYAENRWLATPVKMLTPLVVKSLQDSGRFSTVEAPPYGGRIDLSLKLTLLYLYQDFMAKPVTEKMAVRATLVDARTSKVLGTQTLTAAVETPSNNAYGGVQAANAATVDILTQLNAFVVQHSH